LVTAIVVVACAASAAPAQAQRVTLVPFCDDVTVGAPGSGFRIESTGSLVGVVLAFRTGAFAGSEFTPVSGMLIGQSFPPSVGATTVDVFADSNLNGRVDPGEPLIETIHAPDPCPFPSSKDQCKNGGWRNYGVFKNQGHCIGFVFHQATKACVVERVAIGRRAFREKYGRGQFDLFAFLACIRQRVSA
jgi:hypothetical protein